MRFPESKRRRPASTIVMLRFGFSSASFWAAKTAEMPPPIMQTSLSKRGIASFLFQSSWDVAAILERAALVFANRGLVGNIASLGALKIERHEIGRDVGALGHQWQVFDVRSPQDLRDSQPSFGQAVLRERSRGKLVELLQVNGLWRFRLVPDARKAVAGLHFRPGPVL